LGRGRYHVKFINPWNFNDWFRNLRIGIKVPVSKKTPFGSGSYKGWRINIKIPPLTDSPEIHAVHLTIVPEFSSYDPLLAARLILLALRPSTILIFGRGGSGKTTFLNSFLLAIHKIFPKLRISVIELENELVLPESSFISRSFLPPSRNISFNDLLVQAFAKERPDLLVVGELWSRDIGVWINVSRVASIATIHGVSLEKLYFSMLDYIRREIPISPRGLLRYIDVFVHVEAGDITAIYISDGQRLHVIYSEGYHIPDKEFLSFLPEKIVIAFTKFDSLKVYELLKQVFKVKMENENFVSLPKIIVRENFLEIIE